jgi:Flp pilus assembly protein TadG
VRRRPIAGQASIETVAACLVIVVVAFGGWDVLRAVHARDQAHRLADQAAVLTMEKRPLPAWLRRATTVSHGRVTATVRVCAVTTGVGCFDVTAEGRLP